MSHSMLSRLPGDAASSSPSPSPSPSPPPPPPPAPVASTSTAQPPPGPARTITLTSVHPTDPTKQRAFAYRYYRPSSSALDAATRSFLALPSSDSDLQPLPSELQHAHAASVKRREHLVDRPLLTQKLRDQTQRAHDRDRAHRWPDTRIRVRWADRSLLEGTLPSTDKVVHLYEFVRIALRPDVRDVPFVLYQTPPRTEYRRGAPHLKGKTLLDLDLAPSSAFYIKFEGEGEGALGDALNDPHSAPPLVDELLGALAELPAPPTTLEPRDEGADKGEGAGKGKGETDEERKKRDKEDKLRRLLGGGGGAGKGRGGVTPSWMKGGKDAHKK